MYGGFDGSASQFAGQGGFMPTPAGATGTSPGAVGGAVSNAEWVERPDHNCSSAIQISLFAPCTLFLNLPPLDIFLRASTPRGRLFGGEQRGGMRRGGVRVVKHDTPSDVCFWLPSTTSRVLKKKLGTPPSSSFFQILTPSFLFLFFKLFPS